MDPWSMERVHENVHQVHEPPFMDRVHGPPIMDQVHGPPPIMARVHGPPIFTTPKIIEVNNKENKMN